MAASFNMEPAADFNHPIRGVKRGLVFPYP
jgi:hypothetical protein